MIRDNVHRRGSPYLRNGAGVRAWDTPAVPSPPARAEELAECDLGDQRIKVLVLIPTLRFGGAENDLARNLPRIDHSRFKITVCAFLERGSLAQALLDAGVRVIGPLLPTPSRRSRRRRGRLKMLSTVLQLVKSTVMRGRLMRMASIHANSSLIYLHLARKVASFIRSEDIDVVHAVLPNSYVVGAIATVLARRAKLVVSRVSLNWYQDGRPLLSLLERRVCHRMIDAAICNSGPIRQELIAEGIPPDKIQLIQNGIDAVAFSAAGCDRSEARKQIAVSDEALIFSSVANFYPYKGHADLLKALHLACEKLPSNWLLFTVGSDVDGYMNEMRGLSQTLGLARHVRFLGLRNDVETILHASDIHVSASHTEGLPNNVLEAMCANLPVVATAVGGVPDIVIHGRTGLLVPPGDSQGMACALLRLAHDRTLRRSMGEAGRNLVKSRFTLERSVSAFEAVYAAAAGSAPSAAL